MKLTKSALKQLIKEELENFNALDEELPERFKTTMPGEAWVQISEILFKYGYTLHNAHEWLDDGLEAGYLRMEPRRTRKGARG